MPKPAIVEFFSPIWQTERTTGYIESIRQHKFVNTLAEK